MKDRNFMGAWIGRDDNHLRHLNRINDVKPASDRAFYASIGAGAFCLIAIVAMIAAAAAEYHAGGLAL